MTRSLPAKIILFFLLFSSLHMASQGFTWMKGRDTINKKGNFSLVGITSSTNNPGARNGAVSWTDNSGTFWLFGGYGYDRIGNFGRLSDLWKFEKATNNWTWVHGDDIFIQSGVYGTMGVAAAGNKPGARDNACGWKDQAGNLWLLGGFGYPSGTILGPLNDLWKYTVSTNQWTWMGGSNTLVYQSGIYGTMGVGSSTTIPGARIFSSTWADASGNLWLFGGLGSDASGFAGKLNDLWKYNTGNNQWTWMSGKLSANQNGVYGTVNVSAPSNQPGGRSGSSAWLDATGNFWIFGGTGYDATTQGYLNDLWKYNVTTNEWVWVKGMNVVDQNGIYGSQGTGAVANTPGARHNAVSWIDAVGNMWLCGGSGLPISSTTAGIMQDLWRYKASSNEWVWTKGGAITNVAGVYGSMGAPSGGNVLGSRSGAANWIDGANNLWVFGGNGRGASTYTATGDLNDLWKYNNCFIAPQTLTVTSGDSAICIGETTSLTVSGGVNYLWSNGILTSFNVIHPIITTTYVATSTDTNSCIYSASFTQSVDPCVGLEQFAGGSRQLQVYPNPNNGHFSVRTKQSGCTLNIYDQLGQSVYEAILENEESSLQLPLPASVYFYRVRKQNELLGSGKLIIE